MLFGLRGETARFLSASCLQEPYFAAHRMSLNASTTIRSRRYLIGAINCTHLAFVWLSFTDRRKRATLGNPLQAITVQRVYAIPVKNGKYSFSLAPRETIGCGHAIFPHDGYSPCWYIRQNGNPIQM